MAQKRRVVIFDGCGDSAHLMRASDAEITRIKGSLTRSVDEVTAKLSHCRANNLVTVASKLEDIGLSAIEDDDDVLCYDLTQLRQSFDLIIVIATSGAEGQAGQKFGHFFLALLKAAATEDFPLAGLHHAVLGEEDGDPAFFQNIPRLVDKYLGECGSRRAVMRSEVTLAWGSGVAARRAFVEELLETLQALPSHAAPPVCEWTSARRSDAEPTDQVIVRSAEQLAAFTPREPDVAWTSSESLVIGSIAAICALLVARHYDTLMENLHKGAAWSGYYIALSVALGGVREVLLRTNMVAR